VCACVGVVRVEVGVASSDLKEGVARLTGAAAPLRHDRTGPALNIDIANRTRGTVWGGGGGGVA
jgi:hypothetical protein